MKKTFETQLWIDGKQVALNNLMQETLGNVLWGFSKSLRGEDNVGKAVEVKAVHMRKALTVDAQTYA